MIFHVHDESVEIIVVKMKYDLNDIHKILKEADDIQGALSLERQMHSKATTSLETFHVMHIVPIIEQVSAKA